jgi:hypothetical protein
MSDNKPKSNLDTKVEQISNEDEQTTRQNQLEANLAKTNDAGKLIESIISLKDRYLFPDL